MSLTHTRPEKSQAMSELVYAIREAVVGPAREDDLSIAEVLHAYAHVFASILVGAYKTKNREVILAMLPDMVRSHFPQWEKIYAANPSRATPER
jgi:hypothetical protein